LPLDADTLKQVAPEYRPEHGRWIGIAARSTVFVYNPQKSVNLSCRAR
jgi:iron(III) transport system substrate-binding protein